MTQFKKGMQLTCPHCQQDSVVKLETEMDGWTKVREFLACAMCGESLESPDEGPTTISSNVDESGKNDLLDFLGTNEEAVEEYIADDGTRQFCRDCIHILDHPFKVYCLHHKKDVNPMDDCSDFDRKGK